ncbi:YaaC family protein [Nostoc sp.]|uniref:YaaC family protein n=1 Tax=Nostoc sp. TaxID=1180 RepID=UPI002FFA4E4E
MPKIFTEEPEHEQWQMLSSFIYPSNIERYFAQKRIENHDQGVVDLISGSILQAQEYFHASSSVSLNTSPLLLYYGAVNLLFAASLLNSGRKVDINNHGIKLEVATRNRLADTTFTPYFSTEHGGLHQFCKIFCPEINISQYGSQNKWTLLETLGSILELKIDFESCYGMKSNIVPIQIVTSKQDSVERIDKQEFDNQNILDELKKIGDFSKCYIKPKLESEFFRYQYIFLRRRIEGKDITETSVMGQSFLRKFHDKGGHKIVLPGIIHLYKGLFVLGNISRYRPSVWIPFVRSDSTGERQIIEKFMRICRRNIPNMVLNFIHNTNFYFTKEIYEPLELSKDFTEEQIRKIALEEIKKYK